MDFLDQRSQGIRILRLPAGSVRKGPSSRDLISRRSRRDGDGVAAREFWVIFNDRGYRLQSGESNERGEGAALSRGGDAGDSGPGGGAFGIEDSAAGGRAL